MTRSAIAADVIGGKGQNERKVEYFCSVYSRKTARRYLFGSTALRLRLQCHWHVGGLGGLAPGKHHPTHGTGWRPWCWVGKGTGMRS